MDKSSIMRKGLVSYFMHLSIKLLKIVAPGLSKFIARKVLFTPSRNKVNWPKLVKQFDTKTRFGNIKTYKYGHGKCVWLVHGWSSCAFDFWPLMQQLAERGYSCISFDFPAHGISQGKQSSLPQMIKVFDDLSASLFAPNMIIAHSTGASVVANSRWFKQCTCDLLLISPVLNIYNSLQKRATASGFDQDLLDQIVHDLYKKERLFLPNLNAMPKLKTFNGELKIIHDRKDTHAPFSMSEELSQYTEAKLITANKQGHNKILRSRKLMTVIESYNLLAS